MNILIDEEQTPERTNAHLKSRTIGEKKFEYFTNGCNLLQIAKKENRDLTNSSKKNEVIDINKIEAKFTKANAETGDNLFQRENHPTLDEFKIPKKKMKEESEIIICDIKQKQEKEKEDKIQLEKEEKIRHLKNLKDKDKISEYYKKFKEKKITDFSKIRLLNMKKEKNIKILKGFIIFCIVVAVIIMIYILIDEGVITK